MHLDRPVHISRVPRLQRISLSTEQMKENSYDPLTNIATLKSVWVSKASAQQRRGRAGRCQPGVCFHLFSRVSFSGPLGLVQRLVAVPCPTPTLFNLRLYYPQERKTLLDDFQRPELLRVPLEDLCLQAKLLSPTESVLEFLEKAPEPPLAKAVENAIDLLRRISVFDAEERVTTLGQRYGASVSWGALVARHVHQGSQASSIPSVLSPACLQAGAAVAGADNCPHAADWLHAWLLGCRTQLRLCTRL